MRSDDTGNSVTLGATGNEEVQGTIRRLQSYEVASRASSLTVGLLDRGKRGVSGEAGRDEAEHVAQRLPPDHVRERLEENGAVREDHGSWSNQARFEKVSGITVRMGRLTVGVLAY